jgi:hypothetical protein
MELIRHRGQKTRAIVVPLLDSKFSGNNAEICKKILELTLACKQTVIPISWACTKGPTRSINI